jgi:hypothetical protein
MLTVTSGMRNIMEKKGTFALIILTGQKSVEHPANNNNALAPSSYKSINFPLITNLALAVCVCAYMRAA